jgi:amino-acid N-acetyltransferase
VRLVIVHGVRPHVERRMARGEIEGRYVGDLRVTDAAALECVKEAVGEVRCELEAALSMGLPNTPMAGADIRVSGGNFVTAQPVGVVDGVDLQFTGRVRKIDAVAINNRLRDEEIVLLSPLGYSPTGEIFNLTVEDVAASTAAAIGADKLIFMMDNEGVVDAAGELRAELTIAEAEALLPDLPPGDAKVYLPHAVRACRMGVARAHLISAATDGALLTEVFTHDGIGTMLTASGLDELREATIDDAGGILQLIEPLEEQGVLVKRSRERLEQEIDRFFVFEHDGLIVACGALYPFDGEAAAELACLAVAPAYRDAGLGDRMLRHAAMRARAMRLKRLFVLTTQATHWFLERGFAEGEVEALPESKKRLYNWQRRSKVLIRRCD